MFSHACARAKKAIEYGKMENLLGFISHKAVPPTTIYKFL